MTNSSVGANTYDHRMTAALKEDLESDATYNWIAA